jgi:hypothetical protein
MTTRRALVLVLVTVVVTTALIGTAAPALADGGDFSLDFVAAGPGSYDHDTGIGGAYANRTINRDTGVVESLEGGDFACGDRVVYFTAITVASGASGEQDIEIDYEFLAEPTGQPGAGHVDILAVGPNTGDSGMRGETGDTTASLVSESMDGSPHRTLFGTVRVSNLHPGETFILRIVVLLGCEFGASPTGNLQASIAQARVIAPAEDAIRVGEQTIPFKKVEEILREARVSVEVGACPAPGSPTRPVTVRIDPEGSAEVTITGPGGPFTVTGESDTLDLAPGTYTWSAEAEEGFVITGPSSGSFTVGACPRHPASVTVEVGACPAPGSPTRPVTVRIDPEGSAEVTITGPGGPFTVTGEGDTLDLAPGTYTWSAEAEEGFALEVARGSFTVEPCPAVGASVTLTVGACPPTSSETRPVTVGIVPTGGATVTVTGPGGFSRVVSGDGATLDLAAGSYAWQATASPTFALVGPASGTFEVGSCLVQVLPEQFLPKTGANLPGLAAAGTVFLLLGFGLRALAERPAPAPAGMPGGVAARLRGRTLLGIPSWGWVEPLATASRGRAGLGRRRHLAGGPGPLARGMGPPGG